MSPEFHVGKPFIPDRRKLDYYLSRACDTAILTNDGPLVRDLEERVAGYLGVRHCICVSSGTVGLEIAAKALEFDERGEWDIVMPSWTFPATATAISWIGLNPVFMDVNRENQLLETVESVDPVLGVHTWGQVCPAYSLNKTLYDAAHAFAPNWGQHGDAEVFSFHATKFFHTVEGGCITTASDEVADRCRRLRNFGYQDGEVQEAGINGKLSEVHAAWGLAMWGNLEWIIERNLENWLEYDHWLPDFHILWPGQDANFQYVVLQTEERDAVLAALHEEGILARAYFSPGLHRTRPFMDRGGGGGILKSTEWLSEHNLVLPTGPSVTDADIKRIAAIIQRVGSPVAAPWYDESVATVS